MLFNSFEFAVFFAALLLVHRLLPARMQRGLLLFASFVFYAAWVPAYLLLFVATIGVNYGLLRWLVRSAHPGRVLALGIAATLGPLAAFKYADFAARSATPALEALFAWSPPGLDWVLPLGISFYSFQIIAFAVDVHRGAAQPPPSLARYALFVAFFPQLVAGPILRGEELLPQLARGGSPDADRARRGLWLVTVGLAKKVILADFLLAPFVDAAFGNPLVTAGPVHLVAVYAFAFQIYFDFSGYTDIARGLACMLGYELPRNFTEPYLSRSPAEFWRRWHITLSQWLRDYLYIPLGGNRHGELLRARNLMLTMLLGGLWHGAGWNFVLWGGLHGLLLVMHRLSLRGATDADAPLAWRDLPRIVLLFHGVCVLWIFFRAADLPEAWVVLAGIFSGGYASQWPVLPTLVVAGCAGLHLLERTARERTPALRDRLAPVWGGGLEGGVMGAILALVVLFGGGGAEFIYFQF